MSKLAEYLNKQMVGNVFDRATILGSFATDQSILRIPPRLVAFPESTADVQGALRFIHQLAERELILPITVRGTGLDKTGAAIGPGLILSTKKLNRIEEIDTRSRLVRVQPGVTLGTLNQALRLHGLWLPVGCDERSTIGGLIAGTPADGYARRHGGITRLVERVEVILADGEEIQVAPIGGRAVDNKTASGSTEGELYRRLERIIDDQADTILDRGMQPFDAAGYANIVHVHEGRGFDLLPLLFASQGTLGVITDVILKVELAPTHINRLLISFHDQKVAERFLNFAYDLEPYLLQVVDLRILEAAAESGKKSDLFTRKLGKGLLVMVGFDQGKLQNAKNIKRCLHALPDNVLRVEEDANNHADFEAIQTAVMSYLNDSGYLARVPICDDVYIPNSSFAAFCSGLVELERVFHQDLPVYGSFAAGSYSVRPDFDYTDLEGRKQTVDFLRLFAGLVDECRGSVTGNCPEGRVKALVKEAAIGVGEKQLYTAIKEAFDPYNILNPGVKLGAETRDIIRRLNTIEKDTIVSL